MLKKKYGEWALITGASSGIGEAFAEKLASKGINLAIAARRIDRLIALSERLQQSYNVKIIPIQVDLTAHDFLSSIQSNLKNIEIGILINNAGIGLNGNFKDFAPEEISNLIQLNCIVPSLLTSSFLGGMIQKRKGAIIFLSSTVGLNPTPFMSIYSASKSFNYFLGDSLWYELKNYNIDVLTLVPGSTKTEFPRLNKNKFLTASPEHVADSAIEALGKKNYIVDGFLNKVFVQGSKLLPKKFLIKFTGSITRKMWENYYRNRFT